MKKFLTLVLLTAASLQVEATPLNWTDWTSVTQASGVNPATATGTIDLNGSSIGVTLTSTSNFFVWHLGGGANPHGPVWSGSAYTNGDVDNAPMSEFIGFGLAGAVSVTFDQAVSGVYVAMNSWENQSVNFGEAITVDSSGPGNFGGTGVYTSYVNGEGFTTGGNPSGNWHGVVELSGSRTGFSLTHNTENWHGLNVGIASEVPAPATIGLFGIALIALRVVGRRSSTPKTS